MGVFYVYQLRVEGEIQPFYVGKGKDRRAWDHFHPSSLKRKSHKVYTILKAQRESRNIYVEKVFENLTEDEALSYELWAISAYGKRIDGTGCLTNLDEGGKGVGSSRPSPSVETRVKMSLAMKGLKRSDEGKLNMRIAHSQLPKIKCDHCDVEGVRRQISRYHNANCKSKINSPW